MFSLQKFLGKDPKFFELLEASAAEASKCAVALQTLLKDPSKVSLLHDLRQARQNNKHITEEIGELAVKTFITVLDREDIEALANAIYKTPKPIEKFAERFLVSREFIRRDQSFKQVDLVVAATDTVRRLITVLKSGIQTEEVQKLNARLQQLEAEADTLEVNLLQELYRGSTNPVEIIVAKDLFDLLEKAIDRCRDTGNVVLHICHKNS